MMLLGKWRRSTTMVPEGGRAREAKSAHGNLFRTSLKLGQVTEVIDGLRGQRVVWADELQLALCRGVGASMETRWLCIQMVHIRVFSRLPLCSAGQQDSSGVNGESWHQDLLWSGEEEESRPCLNPWRGCVTDSLIRHSPKAITEQCGCPRMFADLDFLPSCCCLAQLHLRSAYKTGSEF